MTLLPKAAPIMPTKNNNRPRNEHAVAQAGPHRVTEECLPLRVIQRNAAHRQLPRNNKMPSCGACRTAAQSRTKYAALKNSASNDGTAACLARFPQGIYRNSLQMPATCSAPSAQGRFARPRRRAKIRRIQIGFRQRVKRNGILQ